MTQELDDHRCLDKGGHDVSRRCELTVETYTFVQQKEHDYSFLTLKPRIFTTDRFLEAMASRNDFSLG